MHMPYTLEAINTCCIYLGAYNLSELRSCWTLPHINWEIAGPDGCHLEPYIHCYKTDAAGTLASLLAMYPTLLDTFPLCPHHP